MFSDYGAAIVLQPQSLLWILNVLLRWGTNFLQSAYRSLKNSKGK